MRACACVFVRVSVCACVCVCACACTRGQHNRWTLPVDLLTHAYSMLRVALPAGRKGWWQGTQGAVLELFLREDTRLSAICEWLSAHGFGEVLY